MRNSLLLKKISAAILAASLVMTQGSVVTLAAQENDAVIAEESITDETGICDETDSSDKESVSVNAADSVLEFSYEGDGTRDDGLEVPDADAYVDEVGDHIFENGAEGELQTQGVGDKNDTYAAMSYYNAMDDDLVYDVRDQKSSSMCWAFSSASVMESNAAKRGYAGRNELRLSPEAASYYFYNRVTDELGLTEGTSVTALPATRTYVNNGGNAFNAVHEFAQWISPASEEDYPFSGSVKSYPKTVEACYGDDVYHVQDASWTKASSRDAIKAMVAEYGSAVVNVKGATYFNLTDYVGEETPLYSDGTTTGEDKKIRTAYHNGSNVSVSHAVTIIGWDDTIDPSCFYGYSSSGSTATKNGEQPSDGGAWIIKNSYSDKPYYYLSYEDTVLTDSRTNKSVAFAVEDSKNYDHNYHYDGGIGSHTVGTESDELYAGAVYTAAGNDEDGGAESLKAVSFATNTAGVMYEVSVFKGISDDSDGPVEGTMVSFADGTADLPGLYTARLETPVYLDEGEKFGVVVHLIKKNTSDTAAPNTGVTFMYDDRYGGSSSDWVKSTVEAAEGRSFVSADGETWTDTSSAPVEFADVNNVDSSGNVRTPAAGYVRIKAYTDDVDDSSEKIIENTMVANIPDQVFNGGQLTPEPVIYYNGRKLEKDIDYTVSYGRNVSTGTNSGTVTIKGLGNYKTKAAIVKTFNIRKRSLNSIGIDINGLEDHIFTGNAITPAVVTLDTEALDVESTASGILTLKNGTDIDIKYSKNINKGTATVTVRGRGNYTGTRTEKFRILPRQIDDEGISVKAISDKNYTAKFHEPEITLTSVYSSAKVLKQGTDYTVEYKNNLMPGTATVEISGRGNYDGFRKTYFTIKGMDIGEVAAAVISNQTYTGQAITPDITLTSGGEKLVESIDYTVSYENNIQAGQATVIVTGKPGTIYAGTSRLLNFTIDPANLSTVTVENFGDVVYVPGKREYRQNTNADDPKAIKLRLPGGEYLSPSDYTISYTGNTSNGVTAVNASMTIAANSANVTGRTNAMYFKIWPNASKSLNDYEDNKVTIEGFSEAREYFYDNSDRRSNVDNSIKPGISVRYAGKLLKEGVDYKLTYSNNTSIGTAYATIEAIQGSGYVGKRTEYYYIIGKPIFVEGIKVTDNDFTVTKPTDCKYTGSLRRPEITIVEKLKVDKDRYHMSGESKKTLVKGRDYIVKYSNNVDVNDSDDLITPSVTVTGIGNYSGTRVFNFNILPVDISEAKHAKLKDRTYTGSQILPELHLRNSGRYLVEGTDYDVEYGENINYGTGTITFIAREDQKNYTGEMTVPFNIRGCSLRSPNIVVTAVDSVEYTGYQYKPEVSVAFRTADGTVDVSEGEYIVIYGKNTSIGKGTIKIKARTPKNGGSGNFKGAKTVRFDIVGQKILPDESVKYTVDYTGRKAKISIPAIDTTDGKTLINGKDYSYKTDGRINAGTGVITITGKGAFKGSKEYITYTIKPQAVSSENLRIKKIRDQVYTSVYNPIRPELNIRVGAKRLKLNKDYVVTYANNTARGTGRARITFVGNYSGTETVYFNIK